MKKGNILRSILDKPGILVLPGIYDCISARLAERVGFEVLFTSGFGISGSTLGRPDFGFLTATEMLWSVTRIIDSVNIPVVADIDTGYGNVLNVMRTVEGVVRAGAAGIILEDQMWPKKCGHFEGKSVISMDEHVEKVRAAVEARDDSGLVIIGRTDSRAELGLDEAIKRGKAYYEAGADIVFIEAPLSAEELKIAADELRGIPLFANMVEGGKTPFLSTGELEEFGYKIAVFPLTGLFAATRAIEDSFKTLKETGTSEGYTKMYSFKEFEELVDVSGYSDIETKFSNE